MDTTLPPVPPPQLLPVLLRGGQEAAGLRGPCFPGRRRVQDCGLSLVPGFLLGMGHAVACRAGLPLLQVQEGG